jgi:hypothetical protein
LQYVEKYFSESDGSVTDGRTFPAGEKNCPWMGLLLAATGSQGHLFIRERDASAQISRSTGPMSPTNDLVKNNSPSWGNPLARARRLQDDIEGWGKVVRHTRTE